MAGVVPFTEKETPTRKLWNIKGKKTVKRQGSQLAEDGCPESQLVLAKQLLGEKDHENNARLGVFWLIQASGQGSQEATEMLQSCLERGEGITEHNYLDIKACLNTSQNEKLARRAARKIFISLAAGESFITSEQLRRQFATGSNESTLCDRTSNGCTLNSDRLPVEEHWGEKLTEDHLEEAATNYSRGELPLVQRILALTDPKHRELAKLSCIRRSIRHPLLSIQYAYTSLLDLAWRFVNPRLYAFLFVLLFAPLDSLVMMIPMAVFYMSFFFMVVSTLQMLHEKKDYRSFRNWSRLFLRYDVDGHLNTEDPEFVYIKKNLRPYGLFFLNLLLHLAAYPLVSTTWIPQSEFAIVSFLLTFITLSNFSTGIDYLQLLSFGLHVLAKYPYESDGVVRQTWRLLDFGEGLPCFASHVVGNGVEFCLNFRGIFYLMIPGIFFKVAARESWRGTYKYLIPHCVTLAWWQIAVISCQGATLYGLIRSTLAMVGLVLLVPVFSLVGVAVPILAVLAKVTEPALTPITITTSCVTISLLLMGIYLMRYPYRYQILLVLVTSSILLWSLADKSPPNEMQISTTLSWEQFSKLCRKNPFQSDHTTLVMQENCVHLTGMPIHWEAVVHDVQISSISNPLNWVLEFFPDAVRNYFSCLLGTKYENNCDVCSVVKPIRKCHMINFNKYEYEIALRVESSTWFAAEPVISLKTDDYFRNFTQALQPKDRIWFNGILKEPLTPTAQVTAIEIGCVSCQNHNLDRMKKAPPILISTNQLRRGFLCILNFIFNPVIVFR